VASGEDGLRVFALVVECALQSCPDINRFLKQAADRFGLAAWKRGMTTAVTFFEPVADGSTDLVHRMARSAWVVVLSGAGARALQRQQARAGGLLRWLQRAAAGASDALEQAKIAYNEASRIGKVQFQPQLRRNAVAAFVSNCQVPWRNKLLADLRKDLEDNGLHSYGRCEHNMAQAADRSAQGFVSSKISALSSYQLAFSPENNMTLPDYGETRLWMRMLRENQTLLLRSD
jgi:hypothetical protein